MAGRGARPLFRGLAGLVAGLSLAGAVSPPAQAYPRPGRTARVSVSTDGTEGNAHSTFPTNSGSSLSADGRFVAFTSLASNLVAGDANDTEDVFVHERATGTTERVSIATVGTEAGGPSLTPTITPDGRYVAFQSMASNLVPGDTNGVGDIFVHDRLTGATERVSVATGGVQQDRFGGLPSYPLATTPAISADGRFVAFASEATNLVPGDTNGSMNASGGTFDVFVRDRQAGTTQRVSVATGGAQASNSTSPLQVPLSQMPAISADGRYVAFVSYATNLTAADTNFFSDVFVHDRQTGVTERVSVPTDGSEPNLWSWSPSLSADGRYVAFSSNASNLVPADANMSPDVFVRDREAGITTRVSVAADGTEAQSPGPLNLPVLGLAISQDPVISADGRYVAFFSGARNLVAGDTNGQADVFVHDRLTGKTERTSVSGSGAQVQSSSFNPAISGDGRYVAFRSFAADLVAGDTNGVYDTFVRDRGPAAGVGGLEASVSGDRVSVFGWATLSSILASKLDPATDAVPGSRQVGGELTGASLVLRPEEEDVLLRLTLVEMPSIRPPTGTHSLVYTGYGLPGAGGGPGILHGLEFQLEGQRYEVRVVRVNVEEPAVPLFSLWKCPSTCTEIAHLKGGYGTTGEQIVVSVPTKIGAQFSLSGGKTLAGLRAYAAVGDALAGPVGLLDEISFPDVALSPPEVRLGVAPPGTPEAEVAFDTPANLANGAFSGIVDVSSLLPGDYDVWARACVADACGARSVTYHGAG